MHVNITVIFTCRSKDANRELFKADFLARGNVLERLAQVPRGQRWQGAFMIATLGIGFAPDVPVSEIIGQL